MVAAVGSEHFVSFRHVKQGVVGRGGLLPPGWGGELLSELEVLDMQAGASPPSITIRARFEPQASAQYVSMTLGAYAPSEVGDLFLLRGVLSISESENVGQAFLLLREWEAGGRFQRQATRPVKISANNGPTSVAIEVREANRVLQPVITFMLSDAARGGAVTLTVGGLAFGKLYDLIA